MRSKGSVESLMLGYDAQFEGVCQLATPRRDGSSENVHTQQIDRACQGIASTQDWEWVLRGKRAVIYACGFKTAPPHSTNTAWNEFSFMGALETQKRTWQRYP